MLRFEFTDINDKKITAESVLSLDINIEEDVPAQFFVLDRPQRDREQLVRAEMVVRFRLGGGNARGAVEAVGEEAFVLQRFQAV